MGSWIVITLKEVGGASTSGGLEAEGQEFFASCLSEAIRVSYQLFVICHQPFDIFLASNLKRLLPFPTAAPQHCNTAEPQFAQSSFSEFPGI